MFTPVGKFVVHCWNFVFNHEVSPLRNIPDVAIRHYVLQALGFMWAVAFAVATGSYTFLAASVVGHTVLIAAAAVTVAAWLGSTAWWVILCSIVGWVRGRVSTRALLWVNRLSGTALVVFGVVAVVSAIS